MKKDKSGSVEPEMLNEYNFEGGERGKYSDRFQQGTNVVVLEPDVAEAFPTSDRVNEALRVLVQIAENTRKGK